MQNSSIELLHIHGVNNGGFFPIQGYCGKDYISYKIKKIACKSIKGKGNASGLRVIYVYEKNTETITYIEIYHKNEKPNNDSCRLDSFIEHIKKSVS